MSKDGKVGHSIIHLKDMLSNQIQGEVFRLDYSKQGVEFHFLFLVTCIVDIKIWTVLSRIFDNFESSACRSLEGDYENTSTDKHVHSFPIAGSMGSVLWLQIKEIIF
jgi:hypothetical protein